MPKGDENRLRLWLALRHPTGSLTSLTVRHSTIRDRHSYTYDTANRVRSGAWFLPRRSVVVGWSSKVWTTAGPSQILRVLKRLRRRVG